MTEALTQLDPAPPAIVALPHMHIAAVLDKSGSMVGLAPEVISGFNNFLDEQTNVPGSASMSVVLFDTDVTHVVSGVDLRDVPHLTPKTYRPGGMTALLDAVGATIKALREEVESGDRVLVLITTDGEENSSHRYKTADVKKLIEKARADGWEFVFMGADDKAWATAASMGVGAQTTGRYTASATGTTTQYANTSANVTRMRRSGVSAQSMDWSTAEPEDTEDPR